jgi:hypothetical protein
MSNQTFQTVADRMSSWKDANGAYYEGDYVTSIREVAVASLFAGLHTNVVTPPGYGKTSVLTYIMEVVAPSQNHRIDLFPTTSPSVFVGNDDPQAFINSGKLVKVLDKTPFDPNMRIIIADELFRANDPTFDTALHALDDLKQDHCVVWATNNFVSQAERTEALVSRIGLSLFAKPETIDPSRMIRAMMKATGKPKVRGYVPTLAEVDLIRTAKPTNRSIKAVSSVIAEVEAEAGQEGFDIGNPRLRGIWWRVLFYNSVAVLGSADFDTVPDKVRKLLKYAYPLKTYHEADKWANIVTAITDRVQAEIERVFAELIPEYRRVAGIKNGEERTQAAMQLGMIMATAQETLYALNDQNDVADPRISEAIQKMTMWNLKAMRGEKIGA